MNERLYMDGQLVDIPANGLGITLNYKSNYLDGLKSISGNYTNTLHLPRTERNLAIFGVSQDVGNTNGYPYQYHVATYECEGVTLISNGQGILMSIGESIEVVIKWDGGVALESLSLGETLDQLEDDATATISGQALPTPWAQYGNTNYPIVYHEAAAETIVSWTSPVTIGSNVPLFVGVKASWILSLIEDKYGVVYDFEDEDLEHICVLASGCVLEGNTGTLRLGLPSSAVQGERINVTGVSNNWPTTDFLGVVVEHIPMVQYFAAGASEKGFTAAISGTIEVTAHFVFNAQHDFGSAILSIVDGSGNVAAELHAGGSGQTWNASAEVAMKAGTKYYFQFVGYDPDFNTGSSYIDIKATDNMTPATGMTYSIAKSLPKVKIVDFIATLAAITGRFPIPTDAAVMPFVPLSDVVSAEPKDWTSKAIGHSVGFKMSNWAQNNLLRWAQDEPTAALVVNDLTLDAERDLFKAQFDTPQSWTWQYWTLKDVKYYDATGAEMEGKIYEYKQPKPLIFKAIESQTLLTSITGWSAIRWSDVLTAHYVEFADVIEMPKVVEVDIAISPAEIAALDMAGSYYFEQFGQRFALLSAAFTNGRAKCKMLLIP